MDGTQLVDPPQIIARHLTVGCSTGFMREQRGQWPALVNRAAASGCMAVELSALSLDELPGLTRFLAGVRRLRFDYVSVHAPSKGLDRITDAELVRMLARLPHWIDAIVVHPDTMRAVGEYRRLGRLLAVENMDARKSSGRTASELAMVLEQLPEAGLCLDVAHAKDVDASMAEGQEILRRFGHRLQQLHISSLDDDSHHVPLTFEDEQRFAPLLGRCRDVPWILEAPAR
jgi:sugar phosphate isomerase/epimerase